MNPERSRQGEKESPTGGLSRRRFLALMGASAALGAAGCGRNDRGDVVPYVDQPEGTPPGTPRYYASCLPSAPGAPPVLVTTREGRPVKLEGNPEHPASMGALDGFGQAELFSLYSPERLKTPSLNGAAATWREADAAILSVLNDAARTNKRILLITPTLVSPTTRAIVQTLIAAYPTTRHIAYSPVHSGEALRARRMAFGSEAHGFVDWAAADVVVSFEADFLGTGGSPVDIRGFAARRKPESVVGMNRLWSVEGPMTLTGANADHRIPLRTSLIGDFAAAILHALVVERRMGPLANDSAVVRVLSGKALDRNSALAAVDKRLFAALVSDLADHPGRSAVLAGERLPASAQAIVAAMNVTLGNWGTVITPHATGGLAPTPPEEIRAAMEEMDARKVAVLINLGANPAYTLPPDAEFATNASKVPVVISSSLLPDETSAIAQIVLPATHDLESWGDTDLHPSSLTLCQPAIRPLFDARQFEDSLLTWLPSSVAAPRTAYDYLKSRWEREVHPAVAPESRSERFWNASLHEGFVSVPTAVPAPAMRTEGLSEALDALGEAGVTAAEVVLQPSPQVFDGRYADCGWLQELPHPLTSIVWSNAAYVGTAMAERLGAKEGDLLDISLGGRLLSIPVAVQPGTADGVIAVEIGYGRGGAGSVGASVGTNAFPVASLAGDKSPWLYCGASVQTHPGDGKLVRTQEHHSALDRHLILEGTREQFVAEPGFVTATAPPDTTPSPGGWKYLTGQKWGMAIDLSACIGCAACSVACTAENNVPVVGPEQVERGREMHWIRIDRYVKGPSESPVTGYLPVLCQHCDNAPCENVCPVAATAHSSDGLNEMSYNRCVGTRYCANNCPYKVRRFNYFNYHEDLAAPQELLHNPEVSVRSRGVMEKCTFCVQRIREGQHAAKREARAFADGEVRTACQQTCPANAIVFGDVNDPASRIHGLVTGARAYRLLGELGTKPAVVYMAKIRNPYPGLSS